MIGIKYVYRIMLFALIIGVTISNAGCQKREECRPELLESETMEETAVITSETVKETELEESTEFIYEKRDIAEELKEQSIFQNFSKINPDIVGWLVIPGTQINYPIVQTADNDKYLHTSFNLQESAAGSVFLDYESSPDFAGRNNIIYGHNMKNGTMFHDLLLFKDEEFFKEHRYFQIVTPERVINLKAISCYYGKADGDIRQTRFKSQEEYDEFVNNIIGQCPYAEFPEGPVDSIYVLITCSYELNDARTYLIAVEEKL